MSLELLSEIQAVADRYREARLSYDEAFAKNDRGKKVLYWERLIESEAEFMSLAARFSEDYPGHFPLEENAVVIWKRGSVGLQGILTDLRYASAAGDQLVTVATAHGVYNEFAHNLMPLAAIRDS